MKGVIFTEFLELVEDKFGLEVLDQVLTLSNDQGIYTSVGSYDHRQLVKLIMNLSKQANIPATELQRIFGQSVFTNLLATLPDHENLNQGGNAFQFIRHVEDHIHIEVKKLYADAQPPKFSFISETETELVMDYHSARCMSHVCLGLIEGCANYFNDPVTIAMREQNPEQSDVRFTITRQR